jgi:hypothetical protein
LLESLQLESFNESLNAQPLYIPASNSLSERDTYSDAATKGYALLCRLLALGGFPQSRYITTESVDGSGWVRHTSHIDNEVLATFVLAFVDLHIPYDENDSESVEWVHTHARPNEHGQNVPVCVCRLY